MIIVATDKARICTNSTERRICLSLPEGRGSRKANSGEHKRRWSRPWRGDDGRKTTVRGKQVDGETM
ncbi:hypothetical protein E2C01_095024 [Portunus trituberculatus]|uniref:Uncharacterized protein n=1 Tax=Portunus trituberculatus TaxID=210409 RepID=A0A5B7K383_PORTR|nr:hypothetical protein [Portunus trituberculatus]